MCVERKEKMASLDAVSLKAQSSLLRINRGSQGQRFINIDWKNSISEREREG